MQRRNFLSAVGAGLITAPMAAYAQKTATTTAAASLPATPTSPTPSVVATAGAVAAVVKPHSARAPASNWVYRYAIDPDAPTLKGQINVFDVLDQRFGFPHPEFYEPATDTMIGIGDMNQCWHMYQAAAYALDHNWGDDVVTAALLHDLGKAVTYEKHSYFSSVMIAPYVSKKVRWLTKVHFDIGYAMYDDEKDAQVVKGRFLFADNKVDRIGLDPAGMKKHEWYQDGTRVRLCDDGGRVRLNDAKAYIPEIKKVLARTFAQPKAGLGRDGSEAEELWRLLIEPAWLS